MIGLIISYTPGVEYSAAHCKALERDNIRALKRCKGDFDAQMWISEEGTVDIIWWYSNLDNAKQIRTEPEVEIFTDASELGWGGHRKDDQIGGRWLDSEQAHINVLELKAIWFGLKSLCRYTQMHICIHTDSTTALAYVKNMGGTHSGECLAVATKIWEWAQLNENWLSITHIPGLENVLADLRSRKFKDHLEWSLNPEVFEEICKIFCKPEVDLFASRQNLKIDRYISWEPEPESWRTDAFTLYIAFHRSGFSRE